MLTTLTKRNLTTLRKNAREGRNKPGRKRPRKGDVDIEPAPDSIEGKKAKIEPELEQEPMDESLVFSTVHNCT